MKTWQKHWRFAHWHSGEGCENAWGWPKELFLKHHKISWENKRKSLSAPRLHQGRRQILCLHSLIPFHSSVAQSCQTLQPHRLQHAQPPCPSPTPGVCSNPCPSSRWCHPTSSSSVGPFSSCPQCFPASGSFHISQLFTSGGQSIGVSASASVLPKNIQEWLPLG